MTSAEVMDVCFMQTSVYRTLQKMRTCSGRMLECSLRVWREERVGVVSELFLAKISGNVVPHRCQGRERAASSENSLRGVSR